jgi:hypothetical protein
VWLSHSFIYLRRAMIVSSPSNMVGTGRSYV